MRIDCDTCRAPAAACGDCVMTVLLKLEPRPVDLDADEYGALGALAGAGLVPPLRLVVGVDGGADAQEWAEGPVPEAGRPAERPGFRGIA